MWFLYYVCSLGNTAGTRETSDTMGIGCSVGRASTEHDDHASRGSFAMHAGVNLHPCSICKTESGVHYHALHPNAKPHPNWENGHHMCPLCKANPGALHLHDPSPRLFFRPSHAVRRGVSVDVPT